jgi:hypothetical protein|tara:strand:- start:8963 stop:9877 length:915 start_codon:yes stop_codon:yes gene_type:complete
MRRMPFVSQLVMLLVILLICLIFFSLIGYGLAMLLFDLSFEELQLASNYKAIQGLKIVQVFSSLGTYLLPVIILINILKEKPIQYLKLTTSVNPWALIVAALMVITFFPLNGVIADWNMALPLPDALVQYEAKIEETIKRFLQMSTIGDLIVNLIVIALVAAIAEEVLFRGLIQRMILEKTQNHHVAIWVAAIVFSGIHFQFSGFFPRLFLGVLFGYIFYWGKSLWYPIVAHLLHNGITVVLVYIYGVEALEGMADDAESGSHIAMTVGATLIFAALVVHFFRDYRKEDDPLEVSPHSDGSSMD